MRRTRVRRRQQTSRIRNGSIVTLQAIVRSMGLAFSFRPG